MITKKIVKLSPDMNVETIQKQNVREFRPVHFGPLPEPGQEAPENPPSKDREDRRARAREEREKQRNARSSRQSASREEPLVPTSKRTQRTTARDRNVRKRDKPMTAAERRQARADRRSRRGRSSVRNEAPAAEARTPRKEPLQDASTDGVVNLLKNLLSDKAHHLTQCDDARLFRIYEKRVLGRIEHACQTLEEMPFTVEAQLEWVQSQLLPILNNFSQYYSKICKKLHMQQEKIYRKELEQWLFKDMSEQCRNLGWFEIQQVYPYREKFDPKRHKQSRLVKVEKVLHDFVLEIRQIGTMDSETADLVQQAQIVVGVAIS